MTVGGLILFGSILFLIFMINVIYEIAFKLYVKISAKLRKKRRELGEKSSLFSAKQRRDLMTSSMATASFVQDNFTVDIGFENLGLILRGSGKKVLHGVTGEIKHGQLTAVMGLSGCGKSTFITTLANRAYYGTQVGKVFVNGVEEKLSNYNRRIDLTRLDAKKSRKDIDAIVNDVIKVLNLEDVRHSVIGDQEKRGISGGQRKRVNVGIELVSSPLVLFLDEPTSGLDSASSKEVCEALQNISRAGINVITVIHQPRYEIFTMFDTLLLLGKGGRTIYLGPVDRVEEYFEKEFEFVKPNGINLADFVIDISAGMVENEKYPNFDPHSLPEYWEERKHKYDTNARASLGIGGFLDRDNTTSTPLVNPSSMSTSVNSTSTTGNALNYYMTKPPQIMTPTPRSKRKFINPRLPYFAQFWMCFKRSIVQLLRGLPSLVLDFSLIFLCASFLGLLFYNKVYVGPPPSNVYEKCPGDLQKVCKQPADDPIATISALMSLSMALMGSMAALRVFGKEYLNFYRESQTGLSTFCYFWAKDMSMLIVNIFAPIVFLTIYYTTVAPLASVLEYYYALLLVYWASYGLGYFISIIVKPNVAQLTSVVIVFIFNVFSGSTTPLPTLRDMYFPINIFPALSYLTYSHENIYLIELERYRHLYNTTTSMENMGYKWDELGLTIGMVVVFGMLFRIASFVALVCVKPSSLFNLAMFSIQNFFLNKVRAIMKKFRKQ
ncbi:hypothetical protein C9374_013181 [Naegleria lovaniensis]|uniref:ABC transporter domain-containing protein n=1 Tax=Naegleria lovaniensis TaxID=51637 RepID=A0AA88GBG7_NAELO|nr:uncharacterized protein C9374_013181 [Naegleria lovaniensis]KAG2372729.1 hypothetical protein C9374_013181 [Naegleria lovaniensis]